MAPAKVYKEKDANKNVLKNKTLAVIGYGSQGHAHALNLKDSGYNVVVGLYPKSKSIEVAKKQGFKVLPTADAVKAADVIMVAVPDMRQADIYEKDIAPNLAKGKTLVFLHGLSIHSGLIKVPAGVNVIMVAPKGPGHTVRSQYLENKGVPALIAVAQGGKDAKAIALMGGRNRCDPRGRHRDDFQGGDGNRPLRRAGRSLRRSKRAHSGGF